MLKLAGQPMMVRKTQLIRFNHTTHIGIAEIPCLLLGQSTDCFPQYVLHQNIHVYGGTGKWIVVGGGTFLSGHPNCLIQYNIKCH